MCGPTPAAQHAIATSAWGGRYRESALPSASARAADRAAEHGGGAQERRGRAVPGVRSASRPAPQVTGDTRLRTCAVCTAATELSATKAPRPEGSAWAVAPRPGLRSGGEVRGRFAGGSSSGASGARSASVITPRSGRLSPLLSWARSLAAVLTRWRNLKTPLEALSVSSRLKKRADSQVRRGAADDRAVRSLT